MIGSPAKLDEN